MSSFMLFSICATYCTLSSPTWPDGKKHARNVYAHTREECEEKLKVLIVEMKAEIAEAQRLKDMGEGDGSPPEQKKGKRGKKKNK